MRAWLLCLVAGCEASQLEPGYYVSYDLHATVAFDRLHVTFTKEPRQRPAPVTPAMLANGAPAPQAYEVRDMILFDDFVMSPRHAFHVEAEHAVWRWGGLHVLAFSGPDLVGVGLAPLTLVNQGNRHWLAEGELELTPAAIELWGRIETEHGPVWNPCARVDGSVVQYVVREIDHDCDLILDWDDCEPDVYCAPASAPACGC